MTTKEIFEELQTILANAPELAYVKAIYAGTRENIPQSQFPCIILEPMRMEERNIGFPMVEPRFTILIMGYMRVHDKDKQIIGDDTTKGILDMENDIKTALGPYHDLNGKCLFWEVGSTHFDISAYPVRGVVIEVTFAYQQDARTRA